MEPAGRAAVAHHHALHLVAVVAISLDLIANLLRDAAAMAPEHRVAIHPLDHAPAHRTQVAHLGARHLVDRDIVAQGQVDDLADHRRLARQPARA